MKVVRVVGRSLAIGILAFTTLVVPALVAAAVFISVYRTAPPSWFPARYAYTNLPEWIAPLLYFAAAALFTVQVAFFGDWVSWFVGLGRGIGRDVHPDSSTYHHEYEAIRSAPDTTLLRALLYYVGAVCSGHIDFYSRFCADRVIDATRALLPDRVPAEPAGRINDLSQEMRQAVLDEIKNVRQQFIDKIAHKFVGAGITKIAYYDNLVNRLFSHELAKALDALTEAGPDEGVELIRVGHSEKGVLSLGLEQGEPGKMRKPIIDHDHVLVVEANLGPIRTLEDIVALVQKNMTTTSTLHVAVVFDGSGSLRRSMKRLGVPRRQILRLVRADLGLSGVESCKHCSGRGECLQLTDVFSANYVPW